MSATGSERSSLCYLLVLFSSAVWLVRAEQATALCKGGLHGSPRIQELNEIRGRIGADYHDVGICLLDDDDGSKLSAIMDDDKFARNKLDAIFRRWIKGEGRKCTWEILCQCLEYANLFTLAEKVKSACSMARDAANEMRSEQTGAVTRSSTPSNVEPNKQATQRQAGEQHEYASVLRSPTFYIALFIALIIVLLTTAYFSSRKTETEIPTFGQAEKEGFMEKIKLSPSPAEQNEQFLNEVKVIVHVVNNNEKWAVLANMEPSGNQDEENNIKEFVKVQGDLWLVLGEFGGYKIAVIQTEMGSKCGNEIEKAMEILPSVKCVIGVGVAFAFKKAYRLGDVLVSKWIAGGSDLKGQHGVIQIRNAMYKDISTTLTQTFIRDASTWAPKNKFKCSKAGRKSKAYPGGIVSAPLLTDDKKMRDEIYKRFPEAVGGEMEGYMYMNLNEGDKCKFEYIIIKGVADYGDGKKNKMWQFTAAMAAVDFVEYMLKCTQGKMYSQD